MLCIQIVFCTYFPYILSIYCFSKHASDNMILNTNADHLIFKLAKPTVIGGGVIVFGRLSLNECAPRLATHKFLDRITPGFHGAANAINGSGFDGRWIKVMVTIPGWSKKTGPLYIFPNI